MRQRLPARFLVGRIKNQAILQLTRNHHFGDGVGEPLLNFLNHVVHIGVDEAVKLVRPEAEPRHRLQEAVSAPVGTSACHDKLPELVANDLRVLTRPAKLANKTRYSVSKFHLLADFVRRLQKSSLLLLYLIEFAPHLHKFVVEVQPSFITTKESLFYVRGNHQHREKEYRDFARVRLKVMKAPSNRLGG